MAAIDRLSRDLEQLSARIATWEDQGIAIVAPGLGYGDPAGEGRFRLQLWGMLAEHERARLISRILPGMAARLQAGLPLGPLPLGYRVEVAAPVPGQRTTRRPVPDPDTAPVVIDEERLTDDLVAGRIAQETYFAAFERLGRLRAAVQVLLDETDDWSYLARLVTVQDGPGGGSTRWLSIPEAWGMLDAAERRRLLHAVAENVVLTDPVALGAAEDPAAGRFTGVTVTGWSGTTGRSALAVGLARALVQWPGWDLDAGLRTTGWEPEPETGGTRWRQREGEASISFAPA